MGRNKDELIKLAEKITGQECKDVLTKKDALKKIACYYLGEEKEFASIADCLESIVEHGATGGGSGGGGEDKLLCYHVDKSGNPKGCVVYTDKPATQISYGITGAFEKSVLPKDEGKHLFIASTEFVDNDYDFINLIYEDGSPSADLKGKFIL